MEVRFKNFVTIHDSYTQQGLSSHVTFRPIKSGATVPLNRPEKVFFKFLFTLFKNFLAQANMAKNLPKNKKC
jgi:hypothetical protein